MPSSSRTKMGFPHGPTVTQNTDGTLNYRGAKRSDWLTPQNGGGVTRLTFVAGDRPIEELDDTSRKILATGSGTSIFDPVLCELVYRWFCTPNGKVLDPFAGGSVRGIVAAYLGYDYTGIELRPEQIEANRKQAEAIITDKQDNNPVKVYISSKWLNHLFNCNIDYIQAVCHGSCCEGSNKILISLLSQEQEAHIKNGQSVISGLLQPNPGTGKCPYKRGDGLCSIHGTDLKPFGCIASPFTLNNGNTLIVRNRYSKMRCHGHGQPAYKTFRASLDLIFGDSEAERIAGELANGSGDFEAAMPRQNYNNLRYLDGLKHGELINIAGGDCNWITGDSANADTLAPGAYDLVFSCPPYYDLEVYSDRPGEMSAMPDYKDFINKYCEIIAKCTAMLKQDRFACFVVGDIRDKRGFYRNFVSDTIAAFRDAGCLLYNDAILITAVGSLPIRVGKQFGSYRKLGKTHQNVLVFYKGDIKKIKDNYPEIEVPDIIPAEQTL